MGEIRYFINNILHTQSTEQYGFYKRVCTSEGWEVFGLDSYTGITAHKTIFGNMNFGNGAYAVCSTSKTETFSLILLSDLSV